MTQCPQCKSTSIAEILWGFSSDSDFLQDEIKKKKIVLGGCLITDNDPQWECNSCHHRWGVAFHE
jgi:transposase-like protein